MPFVSSEDIHRVAHCNSILKKRKRILLFFSIFIVKFTGYRGTNSPIFPSPAAVPVAITLSRGSRASAARRE